MAGGESKSGTTQPAPVIPGDQQFVHLHLHTEYSLLDGGNRVDKLVNRVAELGMTAVGVTDHGNIFGAVSVYQTCKEKGIKPILGVEAYVTPPGKPRQDRTYSGGGEGGYHLVLLCENNEGWQNLLVLCSEAYLTGFYYKPRIDRELLEKHSAGLIAINGHLGSEIGEHLLDYERTGDEKYWKLAVESAEWHKEAFGTRHLARGEGKAAEGKEGTKRRRDEVKSGGGAGEAGEPPRFYIELQHHIAEQNSINKHLIRLARELDLPLVSDNDAHFLRAEDHDAHDTLICISTGKNKSDTNRMRYPAELYVKSPAQMRAMFEAYGGAGREACDNSVRIAERCNVELPLGRNNAPAVRIDLPDPKRLPRHDDARYAGDLSAWYKDYCASFELRPFASVPTAEELAESKRNCDAALRLLSEAGFVWRYGPGEQALGTRHLALGQERRGEADQEKASGTQDGRATQDQGRRAAQTARLERELKILADKNISAYFLIVWDFVNWGRQRGIPSNARGSGVGTMVGYVLGLSNACPVEYGLLFERFTDPDRSEYPDIDIDLCQDGRGEVINYVRRKYGHVAQIITFGTMKARAAIRDVARVLAVSLPAADRIAKLIPDQLNITLDEAIEQEPDLKGLYEGQARCLDKVNDKLSPEQSIDARTARALIDNARTLEGQARHAGVHAAGVIIATRPLQEIVPLYRQSGSEETEIVTQWDGPTCEKMGLLKMDFLGLRTISIVERARTLIREGLSEEEIWKAVGRGEEYKKWSGGQVVRWSGGGGQQHGGGQGADQVVSRPGGLAARDGDRAPGLPGDRADAASGALRAHQSDASGGELDPDERGRRVRQAQSPGVHPRSANRGGVAAGADDGLRDSDFAGDDQGISVPSGHVRRGRSAAGGPDSQAGSKDQVGEGREAKLTSHLTTGPLDHSTTSRPPDPLDLDRLHYSDQRVLELFRRGDTTGVFQFESGGMRRLLVEMKPDRLEDLIAANALFRPGPMDLIPDYNRRKHGQDAVPKVHDIVDRYTAETYGVMVYQEQVMQIVHGLGGIKLRDAYTLIKNISKKKHDKIEKERPKFVEGAQKQGLNKQAAEDLFELILKFAGYGFNKSHSTGYAIVAYQTAYLKTYFPAQYMAAFLTYESQAQKASEWIPYLEDCRRTRVIDPETGKVAKVGVEVRPPDINLSKADFAVVFGAGEAATSAGGHIRFGLRAIKGVGDKLIEAIIQERDGERDKAPGDETAAPRPFTSLFDFCERVMSHGTSILNKAALESLIKCGVFDSVHGRQNRAAMIASIEQAIGAAQKAAQDRASGQGSLFGLGGGGAGGGGPTQAAPGDTGVLTRATPWSESETLAGEKDVLGFYVSSHPLETWKHWAATFADANTATVKNLAQDKPAIVAGLVQSVRPIVVKSGRSAGQKMAIVTLEDTFGVMDCVLFTEAYTKFNHLVDASSTSPVFLLGRVDRSRGEPQLIVDRVVPIDGVPVLPGKFQVLFDADRLNGEGRALMERAREILYAHLGKTPADFPLEIAVGIGDQMPRLRADKLRVAVDQELVRKLVSLLGQGCVRVVEPITVDVVSNNRPWERKKRPVEV